MASSSPTRETSTVHSADDLPAADNASSLHSTLPNDEDSGSEPELVVDLSVDQDWSCAKDDDNSESATAKSLDLANSRNDQQDSGARGSSNAIVPQSVIRGRQMQLLEKVAMLECDPLRAPVESITEVLQEVNELLPKAKSLRDIRDDLLLVQRCSVVQRLKSIHPSREFVDLDLQPDLQKLLDYVPDTTDSCDSQELDPSDTRGKTTFELDFWKELCRSTFPLLKRWLRTVIPDGKLPEEDTVSSGKPGMKKSREGETSDIEEKKAVNLAIGEENIVDRDKINRQLRALYNENNQQPISFYHFVVDGNSFSKTVENAFLMSFLVRDGLVRIFVDEDGLPMIEPVDGQSGAQSEDQSSAASSIQFLWSFSEKTWKNIIDAFKIQTARKTDEEAQNY